MKANLDDPTQPTTTTTTTKEENNTSSEQKKGEDVKDVEDACVCYASLEGLSITGIRLTSKDEHKSDSVALRKWKSTKTTQWDSGWNIDPERSGKKDEAKKDAVKKGSSGRGDVLVDNGSIFGLFDVVLGAVCVVGTVCAVLFRNKRYNQ